MAAGISGLLRGATKLLPPDLPLATVVSEVVSHATAAADQVLSQVQNAAAQVADLAAQVETDVLSPDGALLGAGSLLDNLETTIDSIVNGVVVDVADVVPTQLLDEVKSLVTGGLNSILDATNGPIGVVASIIDINLCEAVKLVEGLLVTVTGVCGDMASVTSFSPTYSETASAAATGASLSFPTSTSVGLGSASAAQSATIPVPTNAGTLTIFPSATSGRGSASRGANPSQPGGSAPFASMGSNSNGAGTGISTSAGNNGASQPVPGSGSGSGGNGQSAPNGAGGNGGSQPSVGSGSGSGSNPPGNGPQGPNSSNGLSQTPAGSNLGSPNPTPATPGLPIPLSPEGTGPNGAWTGGGNMPSPTGLPNGAPGSFSSISPGSKLHPRSHFGIF